MRERYTGGVPKERTLANPETTLPPKTQLVHKRLLEISIDGVLHETLGEIAAVLGISRQVLNTHVQRLRSARLVVDIQYTTDNNGNRRTLRRVMNSIGGYNSCAKGACAGIAHQVYIQKTHYTRPEKCAKPASPEAVHRVYTAKTPYTRPEKCAKPAKNPLHSPIKVKSKSSNRMHNPLGLKNRETAVLAHHVYTRSLHSGYAAATQPLYRSATAKLEGECMTLEEELERALDFNSEPRAVDLAHLPPYPGARLYSAVHVPRMPRLSGDVNGDAKLLIRAYKAACLNRYGKKPRVDNKVLFRMRAVVHALHTVDLLSPYAWASFRLTQWSFSEKSAKAPGIDYVFSRSAVDAYAAHFRSMSDSYDVLNRVMITPSHAALLERWEKCRRAALCPKRGINGEATTRAVVDLELPQRDYDALASKIADERADIESDLYRRLAAGEWIW